MGPGREPKVCENDELVSEFEIACRAGDYEFADEYKAEIIKRLEEIAKLKHEWISPDTARALMDDIADKNEKNAALEARAIQVECEKLFKMYMENIETFCNWSKICGNDPDEQFMRSVENAIGISNIAKKAFREEILIRSSACSRKGKVFSYTTHDRLKDAIEKVVEGRTN